MVVFIFKQGPGSAERLYSLWNRVVQNEIGRYVLVLNFPDMYFCIEVWIAEKRSFVAWVSMPRLIITHQFIVTVVKFLKFHETPTRHYHPNKINVNLAISVYFLMSYQF